LNVLNKIRKDLLKQIRPQAVPLVDGWNIPDFLLNSCLGRYDGRVYESLWEQTRFEPLNKVDVHEGYYKHLQYLLHGDAGAPKKAKL
jgi:acyl-CoA oxidase